MSGRTEEGLRWSLYFRKTDVSYIEKLRRLAKATNRSVNSLILRAIREFVGAFESGRRDISELE